MKIMMAQCNFIIGNLEYNYNKIISILENVDDTDNIDLVVFSELALSGYPPLDLIYSSDFVNNQLIYLSKLINASKKFNFAIVIGHISFNKGKGKPFKNTLSVIEKGEVLTTYHKRLLPTYDIFDEDRYFEPGNFPKYITFRGINIGLLICEDSWGDDQNFYQCNPVEDLMQNENCQMIISINASPSNVGKAQKRMEVISNIVKQYKIPYVYVNQVGANDDIVFDGASFALNKNGKILSVLKSFEEDTSIVNIFGKTQSKKHKQMTDIETIYNHVKIGIKDYVTKCNFKKIVVGSSGGIDSAVVLAMAVDALGKENVEAITMPSQYSSDGSVNDSVKLCENLGIKLHNIPIEGMYIKFFINFDYCFSEKESLAEQNTQARLRGMILMAFSNRFGNLVLSTGNKSEMAVGYCTLYGDMNGGLAPISDIYKMEVFELAKYYNVLHKKEIIPNIIITKPPSAELAPDQKDTDNLPPYEILDIILHRYIHDSMNDLVDYSKIDKKIIEKVKKMVDRAEYKRRQAPPTIRVHTKAWGAGRRIPIAQQYVG
jgi:NAD+ synthetase